jgi:hypothetical protein
MASSSSIPKSNMQEEVPKSTTQETPAYEIRGRTMSLGNGNSMVKQIIQWISFL